jgi:uncharacterized protein
MLPRNSNISKNHSFFLFGARGTGKSSLLKTVFSEKEAFFIDLLDPYIADQLIAYPNKLLDIISPYKNKKPWIIIDEIQKAPKLLDLIHQQLGEKNFKFALTGSSARKLKRGSANLLAGRAFIFTLFPLTSLEIGDNFNLLQTLEFGTLPECWSIETTLDRRRFLKSYALTYLKEEIITEQIVRNLPPFRRFLEVAASNNTGSINYSNIAKDINSDPKTVKGYYEILEDTLLGFKLQSFHYSIRKRQKNAPKFYFFDTGVVRALTGSVDSELAPKSFEFGLLFESFVINEIFRELTYAEKQFNLSFIRVSENQEIDLVIERAGQPLFLCEIKSTTNVDERHAHSLNILGKDFPNSKKILISNDLTKKSFGETNALHWKEALSAILAGNL